MNEENGTYDISYNLFNYGYKELTQDAFICWLIKWAYYDGAGYEKLKKCGQDFVKALFDKHKKSVPHNPDNKPEIWQQDNKIDVLVRIGDYVLLIEDKTGTGDHSNQLDCYYKLVRCGKTAAGKVPNEENIIPIYLKTETQSLHDKLRIESSTEYKVFERTDFLDVIKPHSNAHPIISDFYSHLEYKEKDTESYKIWGKESFRSWSGFFRKLENHLVVLDGDNRKVGFDNESTSIKHSLRNDLHEQWGWGWVNNPSGGFYGLWWYGKKVKSCGHCVELYLQLEVMSNKPEDRKLCFKVDMKKDYEDKWGEIKWDCHRVLKAAGGTLVRKPKRMGHGQTVTIAEWTNPWLVFNPNGGPDIPETVNNLVKAQSILDSMDE